MFLYSFCSCFVACSRKNLIKTLITKWNASCCYPLIKSLLTMTTAHYIKYTFPHFLSLSHKQIHWKFPPIQSIKNIWTNLSIDEHTLNRFYCNLIMGFTTNRMSTLVWFAFDTNGTLNTKHAGSWNFMNTKLFQCFSHIIIMALPNADTSSSQIWKFQNLTCLIILIQLVGRIEHRLDYSFIFVAFIFCNDKEWD